MPLPKAKTKIKQILNTKHKQMRLHRALTHLQKTETTNLNYKFFKLNK